MEFSPAFDFSNALENEHYASPLSLPPTATPRNVPSPEIQFNPTHNQQENASQSSLNRAKLSIDQIESPVSTQSFQINSIQSRTADLCQPQPVIQNIVATCNINCELNLKQIAMKARNAEYNPKRFSAVIMRIRNPRTTVLIFHSGKIVCTGAKTVEDSNRAARRCARIIQKLGFPAKFLDFKIQNMVGSANLGFRVRLGAFQIADWNHCKYEVEIFPGLIYRIDNPKIVLLIFESGKIVLTGAKDFEQITTAFQLVYPVLKRFRHTR